MANYVPLKNKLQSWENYFVRDLWININKEYDGIFKIKGGETNIGIYLEKDREIPNYGFWFFFAQKDNHLVFKYRPKPLKIYTPKAIVIESKDQLEEITNVCLKTIKDRFEEEGLKTETKPSQSRSTHESVFVPPTYENELYEKSQKDKIIERKLKKRK